jgi:hypothetical protein
MSWLQSIKKLYSLDTLDTRFTIPSSTPPRDAVTELRIDPAKPGPAKSQNENQRSNGVSKHSPGADIRPSLWNTPEFYFYYFIFITIIPLMFKTGYDVSKSMYHDSYPRSLSHGTCEHANHVAATHPAYPKYSHLLSDGWISGRKVVRHMVYLV